MDILCVCLQASKNNRSRVDACEEVGNILEAEGLAICQGAKHRPLAAMAHLVSERDKALRGAALGAISKAYLREGANVWKYVGKLGPQQASLIEERLKALDKQNGGPVRPTPRAGASSAATSPVGHRRGASYAGQAAAAADGDYGGASATPSGSGFEGPAHFASPGTDARGGGGFAPPQRLSGGGAATPNSSGVRRSTSYGAALAQAAAEATPLPGHLATTSMAAYGSGRPGAPSGDAERVEAEAQEQWVEGMDHLRSGDPAEYTDGMKMLNYVLKVAGGEASAGSGSLPALLSASANEMVALVDDKLEESIRSAIASPEPQVQKDWARVAKYALNILMLCFPMRHIARALSLATLRHTVATVLVLLLDDAVRGGG